MCAFVALFRELKSCHPSLLLKFMKILRALSDANALDALERAGAIPQLVYILDCQEGPFVAVRAPHSLLCFD